MPQGQVFSRTEAQPSERARVLLVDDQPARLLSYEAIHNGLNVQCVRALSGEEALERLVKHEVAVILLDVNMPVMDGFELARLIRDHPRFERTPIIFVTGAAETELGRLKGYEVGAINYMAVPVVPEFLRSKVSILPCKPAINFQLEALRASVTFRKLIRRSLCHPEVVSAR